jgi:hypothetical protein
VSAIALLDLPDEQIAPFSKPDEADVQLIRLELERHKRRLNKATPPRPWPGEGRDL